MKSVTDLEQSKKLIEILQEESADFYWICGRLHTDGPKYQVLRMKEEVIEPENYWPAWSLTALLGVLPEPLLEQNSEKKWYCLVHCMAHNGIKSFLWEDDDPVDACVMLIEKLSKEGLL